MTSDLLQESFANAAGMGLAKRLFMIGCRATLDRVPRWVSCTVAVLAGLGMPACNHHVYSPPVRVLPLETAATLDPGKAAIGADGKTAATMWGADLLGGTARGRLGLVEGLEGSAEASALYVTNPGSTDLHRGIYSLRVGAKYRVARHFSILGGVGGGGSAAGGFVDPDVGAVAAYENPHFVPFLSGSLGMSFPVEPRTVQIPDEDDDDADVDHPDVPDVAFEHPSRTLHMGAQLGFRIPVELRNGSVLSFALGLGFVYLADREQDDLYGALATGMDVAF